MSTCPRCGRENAAGASFCIGCGAALAGDGGAAAPERYAGFWLRVIAAFLDGILTSFVSFVLGFVIGFAGAFAAPGADNSVQTLAGLVGGLFGIVYYVWMEGSSRQATLGKIAVGIRVTDLDGGRIGYGRALGRNLLKILSALILGIGYLMAAFTARKQGLHDMLAGTLVVKR